MGKLQRADERPAGPPRGVSATFSPPHPRVGFKRANATRRLSPTGLVLFRPATCHRRTRASTSERRSKPSSSAYSPVDSLQGEVRSSSA